MTIGRYSKYIRPIAYLLDLSILVTVALSQYPLGYIPINQYIIITISWIVIAHYSNFYEIYRFTSPLQITSKIVRQIIWFGIVFFALVTVLKLPITLLQAFKYLTLVLVLITIIKYSIYFLLKGYRKILGGNYRKIVIIGKSTASTILEDFFVKNQSYGYKIATKFGPTTSSSTIFNYIKNNKIDEIYCDLNSVAKHKVVKIIDFAHNNLKTIKLLPDNTPLTHNMNLDYYGYIPIVSIRKTPLEQTLNYYTKRIFDLLFSFLVILLILSWLIPLLAILIKTDSSGPVFFRQKRHGINNQEFYCYKFRSMAVNPMADTQLVYKNDPRITTLGSFLRKSSLDEMPQFINVFLGDMSVVGPRPHMLKVNHDYASQIENFMQRHYIRPGITGLAQVKGYRGEVNNDYDIMNRLNNDLYYIENWSLLLDLKIIAITIKNFILGDQKAY